MPYEKLEDLYKFLDPSSEGGTSSGTSNTKTESLESMITELVLSKNGRFYLSEEIFNKLSGHFTPKNNESDRNTAKEEKKDAEKKFQILSIDEASNKRLGIGTESTDYFYGINSIKDIVPDLNQTPPQFNVTIFNSRANFINPAMRAVENIDIFLNYTPPIVAAQLIPHLDVEFKIYGASKKFLNTPSTLRFLLGSIPTDGLSGADKILRDSSLFLSGSADKLGENPAGNFSSVGMENFLLPQTLTNMEALGPSNSRLVTAKPFLPFASIESLDVTIQNAGAGKFAHKKGSLKLKIHDKGRIGEFSQFIKGAAGINQALVWTTYGWLAPRNRGDEDVYSKFINENMLTRDGWQIVNTQFSFDASGQISVNLELVSQAAKHLQNISISKTVEKSKHFQEIIQKINDIKSELTNRETPFSVSLESDQLLNAGSSNGLFPDYDKAKQAIPNLLDSLKNSGLTQESLNELESSFKELTGEEYRYEQVKNSIGSEVKRQFDALSNGKDPFLPRLESNYFEGNIVELVTTFNGEKESKSREENNNARKAETPSKTSAAAKKDNVPKKSQKDTKVDAIAKMQDSQKSNSATDTSGGAKEDKQKFNFEITNTARIVSFGKLFLNFLLSSYSVSSFPKCNDLQIYFYGLNEQCGPVSGMCISEFPIDVKAVAYAYAEFIRANNVETLDLQTFLMLVIETQFADQKSIAYGMNTFFKDDDKTKMKEDETTQAGYAKWLSMYGSFKPPAIEIFVETGEPGPAKKENVLDNLKTSAVASEIAGLDSTRPIIKRIHIYDKQNNPHKLAQMIIDSGGGDNFEVGQINVGKIEGEINKLLEGKDESQLTLLRQALTAKAEAKKTSGEKVASPSPELDKITNSLNEIEFVERPGGKTVEIKKNRDAIKSELMRGVPTIAIGSNGSLVTAVNVASKTDGQQGAIMIAQAYKSQSKGQATVNSNGLEGSGGVPLRSMPVQLTMSTLGVPNSQLYQTFFIDFNTGTTLDNLYSCNQINHSLTQGKFITNWTFMPSEKGYGKFSAPPTVASAVTNHLISIIDKKLADKDAEKAAAAAKAKAPATKPARGPGNK